MRENRTLVQTRALSALRAREVKEGLNMRLKVTPGMSLAVSMLALVMATTGTAVAAKSMITGHDIKDGSITSADIAKGAIKSKHLAKRSVKGDKIAKGAVGSQQISPTWVSPKVCPGGVIVNANVNCPTTYARAWATNPSLPLSVPNPGGGVCYGGKIIFQESDLSSENSWDGGSGFYHRFSNMESPRLTVNMTWSGTEDVTTLGLGLFKVLPNNTAEPVPNALVRVPPAATGETSTSLVYEFPPRTLATGDHFTIQGFMCTTGQVPTIESIQFLYTPVQ